MKIKTSDLTLLALDWAVAKCEGATEEWREGAPFLSMWDGVACIRIRGHEVNYTPSADWHQGGSIIEREKIGIDCDDQSVWFASYDLSAGTSFGASADTPLIAAMRCYVASKLGGEVELPEELQ